MSTARSAIVTVASGRSAEQLDYTFTSFGEKNPGVPLHAFVIGASLPKRQLPGIQYHLVSSQPDFSDPQREISFRRLELIDQLDVEQALVVNSDDVLCLQPLPPLEEMVRGFVAAASVEHAGSRFMIGQGYTSNHLNVGVFFWNVPASREIRNEIVARGRAHFRTVADDQHCINEVLLTKHYDHLRILPSHYNFRAHYRRRQRGWPTVNSLDGVLIYHNAACMDTVKALAPVKSRAEVPVLPSDNGPLKPRQQFWRKLRLRMKPWIVR